MKQSLKNELDLLGLINKIQAQLIGLEKKIDTLVGRSLPEVKQSPKPLVNNGRMMHTAICADCKKECSIPFKPSGDRPVYCQDCFSRRKMINLSGMKVDDKSKVVLSSQTPILKEVDTPKSKPKTKKKPVKAKKKK